MDGVAKTGKVIPKIAWQARGFIVPVVARRIPLFLLLVSGLLAAGCSTTTNYSKGSTSPDFVREDFAQRRTNFARVAVWAPQLDIVCQHFWRERKASAREADVTSRKLRQLVEAKLKDLGFIVQTPVNNQLSADDQKRLDEWLSNAAWTGTPEDLGPAKTLAESAQADALVCIRYVRTKTTWQRHLRDYHSLAAGCVGAVAGAGGVLAGIYYSHAEGVGGEGAAGLVILGGAAGFFLFHETSWLITGGGDHDLTPLPNRAVLQIALVEGATGAVMWEDSVTVESGPKDLEGMVAALFGGFPR